ncbi:hypothetical protein Poly41_68530 [Novipirellula artificiosorum]|uniref:Uncharacterized protein n=1 Tax=Novipirellula artificiosorum TaxID=2528016 RepID=A0A5C6CWF6_9BACT|nr:hypothetical protein Poly41_68530 [Novipirellula artificiosorum]
MGYRRLRSQCERLARCRFLELRFNRRVSLAFRRIEQQRLVLSDGGAAEHVESVFDIKACIAAQVNGKQIVQKIVFA